MSAHTTRPLSVDPTLPHWRIACRLSIHPSCSLRQEPTKSAFAAGVAKKALQDSTKACDLRLMRPPDRVASTMLGLGSLSARGRQTTFSPL